jgi:hypothetical protein
VLIPFKFSRICYCCCRARTQQCLATNPIVGSWNVFLLLPFAWSRLEPTPTPIATPRTWLTERWVLLTWVHDGDWTQNRGSRGYRDSRRPISGTTHMRGSSQSNELYTSQEMGYHISCHHKRFRRHNDIFRVLRLLSRDIRSFRYQLRSQYSRRCSFRPWLCHRTLSMGTTFRALWSTVAFQDDLRCFHSLCCRVSRSELSDCPPGTQIPGRDFWGFTFDKCRWCYC